MAKKTSSAEEQVDVNETLMEKISQLERENAQLKAEHAAPKSAEKAESAKPGITLQHIKPVRMWTVPKSKILKVHRGTGTISGQRFGHNIILTPGCIVTVEPELAKELIKSKDFQKYGLDR